MIELVFDEKGRLVSPLEYPLMDRWIVVDEAGLRKLVDTASGNIECFPWMMVKAENGTMLPALQYAQQIGDRILVSPQLQYPILPISYLLFTVCCFCVVVLRNPSPLITLSFFTTLILSSTMSSM
jgi:hypothetical protein